jgi:uncharacterized protein (TIGR03435 family)
MNLNRLLGRFGKPPLRNMEAAGERVFQDVFVRREGARLTLHVDAKPVRFKKSRLPVLAFALAALVLALVLLPTRQPSRQPASEIVRAGGGAAKVFNLADGSRVEMQAGSELFIERADDSIRIHLNHGKVTVNAAKQRNRHLYVTTRDITASVVGTVFFVTAVETGSSVGVLEGVVQVTHGEMSRVLHAGEEFSTSPQSISAEPPKPPAPSLPRQSAAPSPTGFGAISIRRNTSNQPSLYGGGGPGRLRVTNLPITSLISDAFDIRDFQVVGAPDWVRTERYDIEATLEDPAKRNEMASFIQALLQDRLKLKFHGESRETEVYFLVPAKGGLKLKAEIPCKEPKPDMNVVRRQDYSAICGSIVLSGRSLRATSATIPDLTGMLTSLVGRRILDKTGFKAPFDVNLQWRPESVTDPAYADRPTLFIALEEQLGLKLESGKASIDVLVIDHIERPSEN